MWIYSEQFGPTKLIKKDDGYYFPSTNIKIHEYFNTKEEAIIYNYVQTTKKIFNEKTELEKRIKELDKQNNKNKMKFNIDELKKSHPEHFLMNVETIKSDNNDTNNLCNVLIEEQIKLTKLTNIKE